FFSHLPPSTVLFTLSLHDALPILRSWARAPAPHSTPPLCDDGGRFRPRKRGGLTSPTLACVEHRQSSALPAALVSSKTGDVRRIDRKSTRLNSSHVSISYAVFCLK